MNVRITASSVIGAVVWSIGVCAVAGEGLAFNADNIDRIIVVSPSEAVHYAPDGRAFYEVKRILGNTVAGAAIASGSQKMQKTFELHLLSDGRRAQYSLAGDWLITSGVKYQVPPQDFGRLMHIFESRVGQGRPVGQLEADIQALLTRTTQWPSGESNSLAK